MILICGIPSEPPVALVVAAAEARGSEYAVFSQREAPHAEFSLRLKGAEIDGTLLLRGQEIPLAQVSGVYARLMDVRDLPENRPRGRSPQLPDTAAKSFQLHQSLLDWMEVAPCRIMNRTSSMGSNGSKPYQAQAIARCGFKVPPTLVTSDPAEVRAFRRLHGRLVFKSISSMRSIVTELSGPWSTAIERVRNLPTQFQRYIPGVDVRVHVAGDSLFATEIQSESIDYRYCAQDGGEATLRPYRLPPQVEERCRSLARTLGLELCGIDLKRTPDGEYYCFEANPSPAFSYYEDHTGQPIAEAIVEYLSGSAGIAHGGGLDAGWCRSSRTGRT